MNPIRGGTSALVVCLILAVTVPLTAAGDDHDTFLLQVTGMT